MLDGFLECCSSNNWNKHEIVAHGPQIGAIYIMHLFTHAQNTEDLDQLESHALFSCDHVTSSTWKICSYSLCSVLYAVTFAQARNSTTSPRTGRWSCHVCFNGCSSKLVELIYGFLYSPTVTCHEICSEKNRSIHLHSPP